MRRLGLFPCRFAHRETDRPGVEGAGFSVVAIFEKILEGWFTRSYVGDDKGVRFGKWYCGMVSLESMPGMQSES